MDSDHGGLLKSCAWGGVRASACQAMASVVGGGVAVRRVSHLGGATGATGAGQCNALSRPAPELLPGHTTDSVSGLVAARGKQPCDRGRALHAGPECTRVAGWRLVKYHRQTHGPVQVDLLSKVVADTAIVDDW